MDELIAPAASALPDDVVDVAVVGGGAAGLNGALMLARSRRSVVVIDSGSPRNAPAESVHGLLGHDGVPPAELYRKGREEVRGYGGIVVDGEVTSAVRAPDEDGDHRFTLTLADGRALTARRVLVATGLRDELPDIPGLAGHWGHGLVHCPYCHGWEVRGEAIGVLAVGPGSLHQTLLFRQLSDDVVYLTRGTDLDADVRARFAARGIRVVDAPVEEVLTADDGAIAGVRTAEGVVPRAVLVVATTMSPRLDGLAGLGLPQVDLPEGVGRHVQSGTAGVTDVPGVWVAGNVTDVGAQVGAAAAGGALAGAHINADLATADTTAALRAHLPQEGAGAPAA